MYVFYWLLANHSPDIACLVFSTYFLSILKNLGGVSDNAGGSNNLDLSQGLLNNFNQRVVTLDLNEGGFPFDELSSDVFDNKSVAANFLF